MPQIGLGGTSYGVLLTLHSAPLLSCGAALNFPPPSLSDTPLPLSSFLFFRVVVPSRGASFGLSFVDLRTDSLRLLTGHCESCRGKGNLSESRVEKFRPALDFLLPRFFRALIMFYVCMCVSRYFFLPSVKKDCVCFHVSVVSVAGPSSPKVCLLSLAFWTLDFSPLAPHPRPP
eukprot:RCo037412